MVWFSVLHLGYDPIHGSAKNTDLLIGDDQFFGYSLNLLMAGILVVQVYIYHVAFPTDPWRTKVTVYSILILEMLRTAVQINDSYQKDVRHWGDAAALDDQHLQWLSIPIITALIAAIVQSTFGWRIRVLSNSLVWPCVVWFLSIVQLVANLVNGILSVSLPVRELFLPSNPVIILWGVSTAVNDVLIAILLSFYLSRMKSAFKATNSTIAKIIRLIVGSGVLTAILAIIIILLYFFSPSEFKLFSTVLSKFYSNSLMVMLNQRMNLREPTSVVFNSLGESEVIRDDNTYHIGPLRQAPAAPGSRFDNLEACEQGAASINKGGYDDSQI
ncbi:hypothetical protein DL96DRAFT_1631193 [Flagelloscypha sp. PMI_526]|nr:hypothetical protein DL96DRAFT_1631193 [Flagelloscypha sp. PMI_526]